MPQADNVSIHLLQKTESHKIKKHPGIIDGFQGAFLVKDSGALPSLRNLLKKLAKMLLAYGGICYLFGSIFYCF